MKDLATLAAGSAKSFFRAHCFPSNIFLPMFCLKFSYWHKFDNKNANTDLSVIGPVNATKLLS